MNDIVGALIRASEAEPLAPGDPKTLRDLAAILGHKQHAQTVSYLEHLRQYVTEDGRFIAA